MDNNQSSIDAHRISSLYAYGAGPGFRRLAIFPAAKTVDASNIRHSAPRLASIYILMLDELFQSGTSSSIDVGNIDLWAEPVESRESRLMEAVVRREEGSRFDDVSGLGAGDRDLVKDRCRFV